MKFKDTFKALIDIENLYRDCSKVKGKRQGDVKETNVDNTNKFIEAENAVNALLTQYEGNAQAQQYIKQIVQDIQKRFKMIDQSTPRIVQYPHNIDYKDYGNYYDHDRYQHLMSYCQLAYLNEQNGIPEEHALKLSVAFDDTSQALTYIRKNLTQNKLAIHDACLFILPEVHQCDFTLWKKLIKTNINDATFRELLTKAPALENMITENKIKERGKKPDRDKIKAKKQEIEKINKRFKELKRKHGELNENEEQEYEQLIQQLAELNISLFEVCAGIPLKEADLALLTAANEYYMQQTCGAYNYMLQHGLTKQAFAKFINLNRQDDDTQIPNILLDGKDYSHPGYYLMKIPVLDEMHAARAACFGKLTNCCQSLSGEAGEPCVIHGLTSPYGGFYVVCAGNASSPNVQDRLLGQCWAWRSQNNAIVFDSIETATTDVIEARIIIELYQQLGKQLVADNHTDKVACGKQSGVSRYVGVHSAINKNENFIDYTGYNDSHEQNVLYDKLYPFYLYNKDKKITKKTKKTIEQIMNDKEPLGKSPYLFSLLNWGLQESDYDDDIIPEALDDIIANNDSYREYLIGTTRELATLHQRLSELESIIQDITQYMGSTSDISKDTLSKVENNSLFGSVVDYEGNTPLMYAAENGHKDIVFRLIQLGADVKATNNYGNTPLMYAIKNGHTDIALNLIELGADVNTRFPNGKTLFMYALRKGYDQIAYKLFEKMDVNVRDSYGRTTLMYAAIGGNADMTSKLIALGMDMNAKDNNDSTALLYAAKNGHTDIALNLIELGADVHVKNDENSTALMYASASGLEQVVSKLLELKVDINVKDIHGTNALLQAAAGGNIDIMSTLIALGLDVHEMDSYNSTVLMYAVQNGHTDMVTKLIDLGLDVKAKDNENKTALLYAAQLGNTDVVGKLVAAGAKLDEKDNFGNSPLLTAVGHRQRVAARKLIELGADVDEMHKNNYTPLMYIADRVQGNEDFQMMEMLVKMGADLDTKDNFGVSPLLNAILRTHRQVALKLIELGADVNVKDNNNRTPLIYAAKAEDIELIEKLVAAGAKLDEENTNTFNTLIEHKEAVYKLFELRAISSEGINVLLKAAITLKHNKFVLKLMEAGADVSTSHFGSSALEFAKANNIKLAELMEGKLKKKELKPTEKTRKKMLFLKETLANKIKSLIVNDRAEDLMIFIQQRQYPIDQHIFDEKENYSLLMYACEHGAFEVAKALLDKGANINDQDEDGDTALFYTVDCDKENQLEILKLLITSGADVEHDNIYKENALTRAKDGDQSEEIIQFLEKAFLASQEQRHGGMKV